MILSFTPGLQWSAGLAAVCAVICPGTVRAEGAFSKLAALDEVYRAGFTAEGDLSVHHVSADDLQPLELHFRYTWSAGRHALEELCEPPEMEPAADDGEVPVSVTTRRLLLYDHDVTARLITDKRPSHPDGDTATGGGAHTIQQYPTAAPVFLMFYLRPLLTAGRGYSEFVDAVLSEELIDRDGLIRIEAEGHLSQTMKGWWLLLIDPNASYLVREGSFRRNLADEPWLVIRNWGHQENGECDFPDAGEFTVKTKSQETRHVVEFSVASLQADEALVSQVRQEVLDSPPRHSFIEDYRQDPPVLYRIARDGTVIGKPVASVGDRLSRSGSKRLWPVLIAGNVCLLLTLVLLAVYRQHAGRRPGKLNDEPRQQG